MVNYFQPVNQSIHGEIEVPGDKSISHRAVILASLAEGTSRIRHFLDGEDCMRTVEAFRSMGVSIIKNNNALIVKGGGYYSLKEPIKPLYFGNSGTTARLMIGVLASLPIFSTVYGDESLSTRPMKRVVNPLKEMNAHIIGRDTGNLLPLAIHGQRLQGIQYVMPVKSAQVKSAILLAALHADGPTHIIEQTPTRNHTENMLNAFGINVTKNGDQITVIPGQPLRATDINVPGDISSAAFFMVAAAIVPNSKITLKSIGLNETRSGIIDILIKMGASIQISNEKKLYGERIGDVTVCSQPLQSTIIEGEIIPRLIDEIPIIALLATQAEGTTIIRDAEELKIKETDRISAIVEVLQKLGANIEGTNDGMIIHGKTTLKGGQVSSYGDHRIAMMSVIASLMASDPIAIDDTDSIAISYPSFFADYKKLIS
ncbi:3-phosphoshikimate 1-carboxyvinyltransferase [Ornithinibacillus salinisoli]|uniref:3-phosphoshikimate 1-carboxyvinyltransferase n=1 Tax=Ornithinibacillus salinisoli TaxID=1848459 RepID=A0ABW4W2A6_9BACI